MSDIGGRRIAVVSLYYTPEQTGIAPYSAGVAEHLAAEGAEVTAFVGVPHYPEWRVATGYERVVRRREHLNGVSVHRFRTFVPRTQSTLGRALHEGVFLVNAVLARSPARFDAVVAAVPALTGAVIGHSLARRSRANLGIIVQDLTGPAVAQSGIGSGAAVARAVLRAEARVIAKAKEVAIVSEGFRPHLVASGIADEHIHYLPNWSRMPVPAADRMPVRRELGWPDDRTVVLHAGNMGLKQGLEHVIRAAQTAERSHPKLLFAFMGDGNQRRSLEAQAAGLTNVQFLPSRYGQQFSDALGAADVLLVNERSSVVDMSLPSKLTSYFVAGRPVVAAVAAHGTTAAEMRRAAAGVVVEAEDPDALLRGVDEAAGSEEAATAFGSNGRRYAASALSQVAARQRALEFVQKLLPRGR